MRVTLDCFSGRPNPVWELAPDVAEAIRTKISESDSTHDPADFGETQLGMRGYILNTSIDETPKKVDIYLVFYQGLFRGYIQGEYCGCYRVTKGLEDALKQQARDAGFGGVVDRHEE
jgi:hypothetical protein